MKCLMLPQVEGITLNPSKAVPEVYDGRYDEYIMTDSDYEFELDEQLNVGLLAEAAAILAIGCVAGLKGISRIRKKVSETSGYVSLITMHHLVSYSSHPLLLNFPS